MDIGLRMYKWGQNKTQGGEASAFGQERFDPRWGGNPPVFFQPVLVGATRSARNPLTGQVLPATYIGLIVPGTGYTCNQVITAQTPCVINGIVTQRDGNYLEGGGEGFIEPLPIQFDPRVGLAWAVNPRTVIRVAGGSFHDGTGGPTQQQGDGNVAYRLTRTILYTDFDNYLTSGTGTSTVPNTSGPVRTDSKRPNNLRFTAAIQRELGKNIVIDAAYVGMRSKYVDRGSNINQIPYMRRFDPAYRDTTAAASASNPGALPDPFLRPIPGYSDIVIISPTGWQTYDSYQMQVTRRFTGRFEMAGSYTWARGYEDTYNTLNGINALRIGDPLTNIDQRRDLQEHILVASYQYQIPRVGNLMGGSKVVSAILDNWRISGISTFGSGGRGRVGVTYSPSFEFTGGGEFCAGSNPGGAGPFNIVGDLQLSSGDRNIDRWFATENVRPATGRGDVGNEAACTNWQFAMPGWHNHDLTLFKDIRLKGNQQLQYRWEIYNLFDQVQFQDVNTTATFNPTTGAQTNTNFGKVTSARTERRMQMSIRYIF